MFAIFGTPFRKRAARGGMIPIGCRQSILCGLACLLLASVALSCDDPFEHSKCRTAETAKSLSPGSKYEAVLFKHYCKPETQKVLATQVEVRRPHAGIAAPGEVVFHIDGGHEINLTWSDPTHLLIECVGAGTVISQHDEWGEVKISYRFK